MDHTVVLSSSSSATVEGPCHPFANVVMSFWPTLNFDYHCVNLPLHREPHEIAVNRSSVYVVKALDVMISDLPLDSSIYRKGVAYSLSTLSQYAISHVRDTDVAPCRCLSG